MLAFFFCLFVRSFACLFVCLFFALTLTKIRLEPNKRNDFGCYLLAFLFIWLLACLFVCLFFALTLTLANQNVQKLEPHQNALQVSTRQAVSAVTPQEFPLPVWTQKNSLKNEVPGVFPRHVPRCLKKNEPMINRDFSSQPIKILN